MTTDRRELFDRWAASYDRSLLDATGFPFEGYAAVLQRLFELADPRAGLRVLDLGTGTGALAALFAEAGCHVTGVDFSEEMLARGSRGRPSGTLICSTRGRRRCASARSTSWCPATCYTSSRTPPRWRC